MRIKPKIAVIIIVLILLIMFGIALFKNLSENNNTANQNVSTLIDTYTTDKKDIKLTIGMFKSSETSYKVFGTDFKELEPAEYEYEIGSISKTFTASILCKAIDEGKINLNDSISKYLPLGSDIFYPTVLSLATHTSGYGEYPFSSTELSKEELEKIDYDFYKNKINIYQGINRADILDMVNSHILKDESYGWEYSNFGISVLGTVLSEVYDTSYKVLAEDFIKNDLGLNKTRLGNGIGNLTNYWTWNDDDTYFAAGGFVSTITDLLKYGQIHLNDSPEYLAFSHKTYQDFKEDGFSMGLGWIIDPETNYLWHNGSTSSYQSFIGIDKENKTVVVVLSNYSTKDGDNDEDVLDIIGYTLLDNLSSNDINVFNIWGKQ